MLKVKNVKRNFIIAMIFMLLTIMSSSVLATNTIVITGNNVGTGGGIQTIPTVNSITTNNTGTTGVQTIPTTNKVTNNTTPTTTTKTTVTVTVTANKEVQAITGWTLSADKKVLTKQYTANANETITLTDTAGNKSDAIPIKVDLSLTNGGTNVDYTLGNTDTTKPSATVKYTKTMGSGASGDGLPKTGIDYSALFIIAVCTISGVYAYIKIRDYNQIQY